MTGRRKGSVTPPRPDADHGMLAVSRGAWRVTESGVSVDAGDIRIRQEPGAPLGERAANAQLIAAAPDLLLATRLLLRSVATPAERGLTADLRAIVDQLDASAR